MVLARMASVDRISFKTLATSVDIQEGLHARGFPVLKTDKAIRERIHSYATEAKQKLKTFFEKQRLEEKFAITLDEYTSINGKR